MGDQLGCALLGRLQLVREPLRKAGADRIALGGEERHILLSSKSTGHGPERLRRRYRILFPKEPGHT